jgi:tripeptide aminopeptidase
MLNLNPNPIHYSGGSDANVFNQKGLSTINIGIGAQHPHSTDEFILIEDLVTSYQIVTTLIDEFSKRSWS